MTRLTIRQISEEVGATHGIPISDLRGPRRYRVLCKARAEVYAKAHALGYSLPRIGRFFNRHHTTVLHGINQLAKGRY